MLQDTMTLKTISTHKKAIPVFSDTIDAIWEITQSDDMDNALAIKLIARVSELCVIHTWMSRISEATSKITGGKPKLK